MKMLQCLTIVSTKPKPHAVSFLFPQSGSRPRPTVPAKLAAGPGWLPGPTPPPHRPRLLRAAWALSACTTTTSSPQRDPASYGSQSAPTDRSLFPSPLFLFLPPSWRKTSDTRAEAKHLLGLDSGGSGGKLFDRPATWRRRRARCSRRGSGS